MKKAIAEWSTAAKLVVCGRDLPITRWEEILTSPVSEVEKEALDDFIFYLKHHRRQVNQIASMIGFPEEYIRDALARRGVSL